MYMKKKKSERTNILQKKQDELGNVANKYNEQKLRTYSDTFSKTWWSIFNEFAGLWKKKIAKVVTCKAS